MRDPKQDFQQLLPFQRREGWQFTMFGKPQKAIQPGPQ